MGRHLSGAIGLGGVYYYVIYARGADGKVYNERGHINVLDGDLQSTRPNSF